MESITQTLEELLTVQSEQMTPEEIYDNLVNSSLNADGQYVLKSFIFEKRLHEKVSRQIAIPEVTDKWEGEFLTEISALLRNEEKMKAVDTNIPWKDLLNSSKDVAKIIKKNLYQIAFAMDLSFDQIQKLRCCVDYSGVNLHNPVDLAAVFTMANEKIHDYKSFCFLKDRFEKLKESVVLTKEDLQKYKGDSKEDDDFESWKKESALTQLIVKKSLESDEKDQKEILEEYIRFIAETDVFKIHDSVNRRNVIFAMLDDILRLIGGEVKLSHEGDLVLDDLDRDYDPEALKKEEEKYKKKLKTTAVLDDKGNKIKKDDYMEQTVPVERGWSGLLRVLFWDVFEVGNKSHVLPQEKELRELNLPKSIIDGVFGIETNLRALTNLSLSSAASAKPIPRYLVLLLGMFILFFLNEEISAIKNDLEKTPEENRAAIRDERLAVLADKIQSEDSVYISELVLDLWDEDSQQVLEEDISKANTYIRFYNRYLRKTDFYKVYLPCEMDRLAVLTAINSANEPGFTMLGDLFELAGY